MQRCRQHWNWKEKPQTGGMAQEGSYIVPQWVGETFEYGLYRPSIDYNETCAASPALFCFVFQGTGQCISAIRRRPAVDICLMYHSLCSTFNSLPPGTPSPLPFLLCPSTFLLHNLFPPFAQVKWEVGQVVYISLGIVQQIGACVLEVLMEAAPQKRSVVPPQNFVTYL